MTNPQAHRTSFDPVVEPAVQEALATTRKKEPRHPWFNVFFYVIIVLFLVVGTFGAVIGGIDSYRLNNQSQCQKTLLQSLTEEQQARVKIQADDRNAQSIYNRAIAEARTRKNRVKAYNEYQKEARKNEKAREKYPVPTFTNDVCKPSTTTVTPSNQTKNIPTPPGTKLKTTTINGTPTIIVVTPSVQPSSSKPSSKSSQTYSKPTPQPTLTKTRTVTKTAPAKSTVPSKPKSVKTSPGLVQISGCSISVLGIKVC